jgi:hypothetical protein
MGSVVETRDGFLPRRVRHSGGFASADEVRPQQSPLLCVLLALGDPS